ncbi:hypothetical protein FACS1894191_4480 [Clostridia bacterium]|nr:hypothetical protein FACS1894191_4480 [Clostridia bacterium]
MKTWLIRDAELRNNRAERKAGGCIREYLINTPQHAILEAKRWWRGLRVYLDNCSFNRPFDKQDQLKIKLETDAKLFVQKKILSGDYELVWSYVLELENNNNPYPEKRGSIGEWKNIAAVHCVENEQIIAYAEKLYAIGFKAKDALHTACAVDAKADYFITTDDGILKRADKVKEIKIINPLIFVSELEES